MVRWPVTTASTRSSCGRARTKRPRDLEGDAPPLYIQEKIDPRVLVENLRRTARAESPSPS
jgi:hypothetical protein